MKQLLIIPIAVLTSCCCTNKTTASKEKEANLNTIETVSTINSDCPTDGKCTVQVLKNKSMNVLTDEIGAVYYSAEDNADKSIIIYKYERNVPKGLQDADYREEIVFEIDNSEPVINKNDFTLQSTKMLYGRFCFCRGQTGFYKVGKGNLELENKNNQIQFKLDFTVSEVPQTIKTINYTIKN
ncbi:hypothetical protein [Flavobacterium sp.]|uniref:hypothetical protein n=1 Tax=Flavobacterium sp. TaxID=239 RepID=UPI000ED847E3|nr:hypothetical protein [Flavobacterium sp.]HCQ12437.1 hypothetical protein [Flavobacterium sp.]